MTNSIDLVLFFTQGVSLQTWDSVGMLDREIALYRSLRDHGVSTSFVTYGGSGERDYQSRIPDFPIRANSLNLPEALYQRVLMQFPSRGNIFKSNQISGAEVALTAARRASAKFIARCGYLPSLNNTHRYGLDSPEVRDARELEGRVFKSADQITVTTQLIKNEVANVYDVDPAKIEIIPNYVETDRFRPLPNRNHQPFRIGFVGRLSYEKNLARLIDAVTGLNVELHLVGGGPLLGDLQTQAGSMRELIHFRGNLPHLDLPKFLNTCHLFVLPSLYEGHPKAMLEAMACGLPVIGSSVQGIRELIRDGENGLLCAPDAVSIRAVIERALADSELRLKLGRNARRFVEENFSLDRIVDLELAVLNELAE